MGDLTPNITLPNHSYAIASTPITGKRKGSPGSTAGQGKRCAGEAEWMISDSRVQHSWELSGFWCAMGPTGGSAWSNCFSPSLSRQQGDAISHNCWAGL